MKQIGKIRNLVLAVVLGLPLLSTGRGVAGEKEPFGFMAVDEVIKRLSDKDVFVFDANSETVYLENHVPGAKHMQFRAVSDKTLPKNRDATLIFYCKNPH